MLKQRKGEYVKFSKQHELNYNWLKKFSGGFIPNPSVLKMEQLYIALYLDKHGHKPTSIPLR